MGSFVFTSTCVIVAIAVTSLLMYEALRVTWRIMASATQRHGRILYALGAAFAVHVGAIWIYGLLYFFLSEYADVGTLAIINQVDSHDSFSLILCAYFSAATYTSLGFGDVVPTGDVRMVAGAEALNGLVLIGWSVTFTFLAMEEFWERPFGRRRE